MSRYVAVVQYWGGCPRTPNSKWRRFLCLIQQCAEQGLRTYLVWSANPDDPELSKPFRDIGCEIIIHPRARGNFDLNCVWRTYRLLRQVSCDIFHCHNVHTSPLIGSALAGVPVRIWSKLAMSPYYEKGIKPRGIHRLAPSTRISCRLAHRVLALSAAVRDELTEQGISPNKIMVVPAPIEMNVYAHASTDGLRGHLGFCSSDILITSVGHAVPVKGWDILIEAFAGVARMISQAHLLLVGSTEEPNEVEFAVKLKKLTRKLELNDRVHFLGRRKDIPQILQDSDIFAFPSRSDGQGLALTEALVAGLPCIAANTGGIPGLIEHGRNGLLFAREDVGELSAQLVHLIKDKELRSRLGSEARISARRFDMQTYVDTIMDTYRSLLERA